jgi:hypothetical protein
MSIFQFHFGTIAAVVEELFYTSPVFHFLFGTSSQGRLTMGAGYAYPTDFNSTYGTISSHTKIKPARLMPFLFQFHSWFD